MKKIKTILAVLISMVLFFGLYTYADNVFRVKEVSRAQSEFTKLPKDSVDVIFIGSSHQYCSIDTEILYYEYGINGYMLGISGETVAMSYYSAMEAIERQHPRMIVFEASFCSNDFTINTEEMNHRFFDGMPIGKVKSKALKDLIDPENRIFYYLNLPFYYERWRELDEDDFILQAQTEFGTQHYTDTAPMEGIPLIGQDEKKPISETNQDYLNRLEENDVELVAYIAPYNSQWGGDSIDILFERQRMFNWLGDYFEEQNIPYINLFYSMNDIGLNTSTDFYNREHLNISGQAKLTRYMAECGYFE